MAGVDHGEAVVGDQPHAGYATGMVVYLRHEFFKHPAPYELLFLVCLAQSQGIDCRALVEQVALQVLYITSLPGLQ